MESESSGMPDNTSFPQNAEGWDEATSLKEMTCDHNVHCSDMNSHGVEFSTSQGGIFETLDDQDTMSSVKEEQKSGNAFESHVETPMDDVSYDQHFSPSHVCKELSSTFNHKDLSPVSNGDHLPLESTEETFRFHNRDVFHGLSGEDSPSSVNQEEKCYRGLNDVHLAFQQPEEQVHEWTHHSCSNIFFEHFHLLFFEFCSHKFEVSASLFCTLCSCWSLRTFS